VANFIKISELNKEISRHTKMC